MAAARAVRHRCLIILCMATNGTSFRLAGSMYASLARVRVIWVLAVMSARRGAAVFSHTENLPRILLLHAVIKA